jgi:hypothetical protein
LRVEHADRHVDKLLQALLARGSRALTLQPDQRRGQRGTAERKDDDERIEPPADPQPHGISPLHFGRHGARDGAIGCYAATSVRK